MAEKNSNLYEFTKGIIKQNPTLVTLLGMCPTLAVTTMAKNGIGMGLATTFVACLLKLCYIPFEKRYPKGCKTALFYRNNRRLRYSYRVSYERLYT